MTNIRLDPALWMRVKAAAGEHGTTLERWVTDALEARLSPTALRRGATPTRDGEAGASPAGLDAKDGSGTAAQATQLPPSPLPPASGNEGELQALQWRVEALEATVDYLAGIVGAGFPLGRSRADRPPVANTRGEGRPDDDAVTSPAPGLPAAVHERGADER